MRLLHNVFNFIGLLVVMIYIGIFYSLLANDKQDFENMRISYALDNATVAAYNAAMTVNTIGTDYVGTGLLSVLLTPDRSLEAFTTLLCYSYDLDPTESNRERFMQSIPTAAVLLEDGYYIANWVEDDTTPLNEDGLIGKEFMFNWGIKRPYFAYSKDGDLYKLSLVSSWAHKYLLMPDREQTIDANGNVVSSPFERVKLTNSTSLTKADARKALSSLVLEDLNNAVYNARVLAGEDILDGDYIYLSTEASTQVSTIKAPTLLFVFQDSSWLNGTKVTNFSLGGASVKVASKVVGFSANNGCRYYCYADQLVYLDSCALRLNKIEKSFDTVHEAALAGYSPCFALLTKEIVAPTLED